MKLLLGAIFGLFMLMLPNITLPASQGAEWNQNIATTSEQNVVLQKSVISMHIPSDSKLPFGCVWGTVQNAAPGYPVVIQIYQNGKPVYFAQTNVKSDGSYEQYFRVQSIDGTTVTHVFEGDYTVDIYKTVNAPTTGTTST
jgi:hypothetical protein